MGTITNIYPKSGLYQLITGSEPTNELQSLIRRDMNHIIDTCCKKGVIYPIESKAAQATIKDCVKGVIKKHLIHKLNEGNDYATLMYDVIVTKIKYHNVIKCGAI